MKEEKHREEMAALQARYDRLNALYQVSKVIHSTLEPHEALRLILGEAVRLVRATSGSVILVNPTNSLLEIHASHNLPPGAGDVKLRLGEGITGWVAEHGRTARVPDVLEDERYVMVRENVRSEMAVPLEVAGEVRGVLNVDSDRAQAFTPADEALLQELSLQAAQVIHHTWLYEQLRLKAQLFESLVSVGRILNSTTSLGEALTVVTREASVLMEAKMSSLLLLDETREWLDLCASDGASTEYLMKPRLSVAESLVGIVVRRKKPIQIENVQTSTRYQNVEVARKGGLISLLSVPLVFAGQAIGALSVYKGTLHQFSNEEVRILSALADLSAIAIEKARLHERVAHVEEHLRQNEKLSAIGLLAAEVAHEIRNPLTVMKMLYHSMDLRFEAGDPRTQDAKIMGEKMDHMNKIVEQVLDLARDAEPRMEPLSINRLIDDLSLLVRHKLRHAQIELRRELEEPLPDVIGDATQLEQVFLNLTLNAVEAMPAGGCLTIHTSGARLPRRAAAVTHLLVEFLDTGEGMTKEQQERVFSSLLSSRKARGTGLGLAIVARIVEAHRGRIKVRSELGKGTLVRLWLPCAAVEGGTATAGEEKEWSG